MSQTHTYKVEMTCEGCSNAVKKVLGKLGDKVQKVDISLPDQTVKVQTGMSSEEILAEIKKTGKPCQFLSSA